MKTALASLAALACLAGGGASAQSLAYGVTLGNIQTVRDAQNGSTITGSLANQSARPINSVMLTFVLYDEQGPRDRPGAGRRDGTAGAGTDPAGAGSHAAAGGAGDGAGRAGLVAHASMRPFYFAGIGNRARHVTRPQPGRADPAPPVRSGAPGERQRRFGGDPTYGKIGIADSMTGASARSPFLRLSARQSPGPVIGM